MLYTVLPHHMHKIGVTGDHSLFRISPRGILPKRKFPAREKNCLARHFLPIEEINEVWKIIPRG